MLRTPAMRLNVDRTDAVSAASSLNTTMNRPLVSTGMPAPESIVAAGGCMGTGGVGAGEAGRRGAFLFAMVLPLQYEECGPPQND
jgi:hypothetical protein